jgi:uncharacterized protein YdcH (DUF465 family)
MTGHIDRKFADRIESIQNLLKKDATFAEMCGDYEEICNWLASKDRSESRPSEEIDRARELKQDLEDEIEKALGYAGL